MSEDPPSDKTDIPQNNAGHVVTRRADDFKQTYADHFNFTISEKNIEAQIISDNTFGATQFAKNSEGRVDPSTADREFVEEQALKLRIDSAKEFTALMLQSILKKETLDRVARDERNVTNEDIEKVSSVTLEPEEVDEIIQELKEKKLGNEY